MANGQSYNQGTVKINKFKIVTAFYEHTIWISNCIQLDWHFTAQAIPSNIINYIKSSIKYRYIIAS